MQREKEIVAVDNTCNGDRATFCEPRLLFLQMAKKARNGKKGRKLSHKSYIAWNCDYVTLPIVHSCSVKWVTRE